MTFENKYYEGPFQNGRDKQRHKKGQLRMKYGYARVSTIHQDLEVQLQTET